MERILDFEREMTFIVALALPFTDVILGNLKFPLALKFCEMQMSPYNGNRSAENSLPFLSNCDIYCLTVIF